MNDIQAFIDRQLGICSRLQYDNALKRLIVAEHDSYLGVQSSLTTSGDFNPEPPIFACRFAEASGFENFVALANEDGRVAIQDTSVSSNVPLETPLEGFQSHNNAVFDLAWMPGHMKFITVSGDHTARLWDIQEGIPQPLQIYNYHTKSVKTAVFASYNPAIFATGGRDGHVLVWDARAKNHTVPIIFKPDNCLFNCHSAFTPKTPTSASKRSLPSDIRATSITGLVFQDDNTLISCGECDGNIKVWDLRKNYSVYKKNPLPKHAIPYCGSSTKNGYTNLVVDESKIRLYVSCRDNVIYCFNISTYTTLPEQRYVGHENGTFYIKTSLSPDGKYLVSGSSDKNAYIWNVKYSQPLVKLTGHSAEVTCAAWCQKGDTKIVTCSDDSRHKIWRISKEFLSEDEVISLRGRAEIIPRARRASLPDWGQLEKTPNSLKRKASTPHQNTKRLKGSPVSRKSKRCLTDMMNLSKNYDDDAKRTKLDLTTIAETNERTSDLRNIQTNQILYEKDTSYRSGVKRHLDTNEEASTSKTVCIETDMLQSHRCYYESPKKVCGDSFISPSVRYKPSTPKKLTPKKLTPTKSPKENVPIDETSNCPTSNLPNYVLTGEAPHLRLMSPIKKKDTTNWLTLIVKEKMNKVEGERTDKALRPLSPKPTNVTVRRGSNSEKPISKIPKGKTLLEYFNSSKAT